MICDVAKHDQMVTPTYDAVPAIELNLRDYIRPRSYCAQNAVLLPDYGSREGTKSAQLLKRPRPEYKIDDATQSTE